MSEEFIEMPDGSRRKVDLDKKLDQSFGPDGLPRVRRDSTQDEREAAAMDRAPPAESAPAESAPAGAGAPPVPKQQDQAFAAPPVQRERAPEPAGTTGQGAGLGGEGAKLDAILVELQKLNQSIGNGLTVNITG